MRFGLEPAQRRHEGGFGRILGKGCLPDGIVQRVEPCGERRVEQHLERLRPSAGAIAQERRQVERGGQKGAQAGIPGYLCGQPRRFIRIEALGELREFGGSIVRIQRGDGAWNGAEPVAAVFG